MGRRAGTEKERGALLRQTVVFFHIRVDDDDALGIA